MNVSPNFRRYFEVIKRNVFKVKITELKLILSFTIYEFGIYTVFILFWDGYIERYMYMFIFGVGIHTYQENTYTDIYLHIHIVLIYLYVYIFIYVKLLCIIYVTHRMFQYTRRNRGKGVKSLLSSYKHLRNSFNSWVKSENNWDKTPKIV